MTYNFSNLLPADFEDLVRDLIGAELGIRFESFAPGPDGGIDGRHTKNGDTILQAKHYVGSTFAKLKSTMKQERLKIDVLAPQRYLLVTSRSLTPPNKAQLAKIIGSSLKSQDDIFTPQDLNLLLKTHPEVHKRHLKLWLSETAVLESVVHAAAEAFNNITRGEIEEKVKLYATNPSFYEANATLEKQHLLIISGPPGVGKTTLAEMLAFTHIGDGWKLVAIRNLEDGFAKINDMEKQVFFFDDFLGKIALDKRALAHTDSELTRFIRRIVKSPNARFILTTRAYIFEEARRVSEHLADARLDIAKYLLDVGKYTRRIKARILYNHLLVANTPLQLVEALLDSDVIPKIIDHPHYNPRIIEFMTDGLHLATIEPNGYPDEFLEALAHPDRIWDIAFRTHISKPCQHLLFCLFFSNDWFASISELRDAYTGVHPRLSIRYGDSYDPKDFEEALLILEGGFLTILGENVRFVNPSLRDYINRYISDPRLIREFVAAAKKPSWARAVWRHSQKQELPKAEIKVIASSFVGIIPVLFQTPTFTSRIENRITYRQSHDLSNTDRIELLIEWYESSRDKAFWDAALNLTQNPIDGFDSGRDGAELIELLAHIREGDYYGELPDTPQFADLLEIGAIAMIGRGVASDELEKLADAVDNYQEYVGQGLIDAISGAIMVEVEAIDDVVESIDSESTLESHGEILKKLGARVGIPERDIARISGAIERRMEELEESSETSSSPLSGVKSEQEPERFDDAAIRSLFASLRQR